MKNNHHLSYQIDFATNTFTVDANVKIGVYRSQFGNFSPQDSPLTDSDNINMMCEHPRRPKLFCGLQSCQKSQCCACSICMKTLHNHDIESYLNQKDVSKMLSHFQLPVNIKETRKAITLKAYKLLNKFKTELTTKIDEFVNDIMSKIKYPFLYNSNILDSYRNIRDRQYQKLNWKSFKTFCKITENLTQQQFINQEQQYYSTYVRESQQIIRTLPEKIKNIQTALGFKMSEDFIPMCQYFVQDAEGKSSRRQKRQRSLSPEKNADKSIRKLSQHPGSITNDKKQLATPNKHSLNNSFNSDNLCSRAYSETKNTNKSDKKQTTQNMALSIEISDLGETFLKRSNTSTEVRNQAIISVQISKQSTPDKPDKDIRNQYESTKDNLNASIYSYEEQNKSNNLKNTNLQTIYPKYDPIKQFPIDINKYAEIKEERQKREQARKKSFNEQMEFYMREREQNIKKRLEQMKKQNQIALERREKIIKTEKKRPTPVKVPSIKNSEHFKPESLNNTSIIYHKIGQPSSRKEKKSPTRKNEVPSPHKHPKRDLSPQKRDLIQNASINKRIVAKEPEQLQLSNKSIHHNLGNLTKQIPLLEVVVESPKKHLLQNIQKIKTSIEGELQGACMLVAQLSRIQDRDKQIQFLEKYVDKYENSLTGVEQLSFLYLEEGKAKECLMLAKTYLEKMDRLKVPDEYKLHLVINQSAALNFLGHFEQTVPLLTNFLQLHQHYKLHKNLGDALFNLSEKESAIYHYQKAIKLNPSYDQAYYNLSALLYLQTSYFNALMNIEKALKYQPTNQVYLELQKAIKARIKNSPIEQ